MDQHSIFQTNMLFYLPKTNVFVHVDIDGMVINYVQLETRINEARKMDVILLTNARLDSINSITCT